MTKHIKDLEDQLIRLGCKDDISVSLEDETRPNGFVVLDDVAGGGDSVLIDPEQLAELLSYLPPGAPIDEGEEGSVWDVILGLKENGFRKTLKWLNEEIGWLTRYGVE
jgi:hypothetical protein